MVLQGRLVREQAEALLADSFRIAEVRTARIPPEVFAALEMEATYRIPRDPDDGDFLGCSIPTWTTDTLLAHLAHAKRKQR